MGDIQQNTLYLTVQGSHVGRDHLTWPAGVPAYPDDLPREEQSCGWGTD
jgi:hypothetical protein